MGLRRELLLLPPEDELPLLSTLFRDGGPFPPVREGGPEGLRGFLLLFTAEGLTIIVCPKGIDLR